MEFVSIWKFLHDALQLLEHKGQEASLKLSTPGGSVNYYESDGRILLQTVVDSLLVGFSCSGNRSSKTFKPKKNIPEGSHQYELLKHAEATLGSGNLRQAVMLPDGEDLNEWIAVNSKQMNYGTLNLQQLSFCARIALVKRLEHLQSGGP